MKPDEVHRVLKSIGADKLCHANTVTTSCTFLEQGALVSRGYVESHGLKQTQQASDEIDKKYGIWNAVFLDHVDIHYRGGRKKGPNQYGPVLFMLDLDVLLHLPAGTNVRVTRNNPIHWTDKQKDEARWYLTPDELAKNIVFGDFDKMLVIDTPDGKVDFPERRVRIALDDPQRKMSNGVNAFDYADGRLKEAAKKGRVVTDISVHACRSDCTCVARYKAYDAASFDSRFV